MAMSTKTTIKQWILTIILLMILQQPAVHGLLLLLRPTHLNQWKFPQQQQRQQKQHHKFLLSSILTLGLENPHSKESRLHLFFDEFLNPYGVSPTSNYTKHFNNSGKSSENSSNNSNVELLQALLPHQSSTASSKNEKARARAMEAFQRQRLGEQLRWLRRKNQKHQQQQQQLKGDLLKQNDLEEKGAGATITMLQNVPTEDEEAMENAKTVSNIDNDDDSSHTKPRSFLKAKKTRDLGDSGNNQNDLSELMMGNSTNMSSSQLRDKLEQLHRKVEVATRSTAHSTLRTHADDSLEKPVINRTLSKHQLSLVIQNFLSTTHLPLPPREDASVWALLLAPLAYILTSIFLLTATGVYAMLAVLDVLWNDHTDYIGDFSTRTCLKEAGNVFMASWDHVFLHQAILEQRNSLGQRVLEAIQSSFIALLYVTQCVVGRAAKLSKFAHECMEAATGSLRYFLYSLRAIKVIWIKMMGTWMASRHQLSKLIGTNASKGLSKIQKLKRKFHLHRLFSYYRDLTANRRSRVQSFQLQQQRLRFEREYQDKLNSVNQETIILENRMREILEAQHRLEEERKKLLCEGINVLAWYFAVSEAASANNDKSPKSNWNFGNWWNG